jgi:RimJ/RimL family protein N-acetyltransferase
MTPLLASHLLYFRTFLRCTRIHGAAFEDNIASLKAQERNGMRRYGVWEREISEKRGGGRKNVVVLKWEEGMEDGA